MLRVQPCPPLGQSLPLLRLYQLGGIDDTCLQAESSALRDVMVRVDERLTQNTEPITMPPVVQLRGATDQVAAWER